MTASSPLTPYLICLAHRGASGHAPENTLSAFEKAVELGADWIEMDVYAVEDELVVIHDEELKRTTSGSGPVCRQSPAALKCLDAGNGQKIPFLAEVLDLIDRRVNVNIEIKGKNTVAPLIRLIERYVNNHHWHYDNFLISSFDHKSVKEAGAACPRLKTAPNLSGRWRRKNKILEPAEGFYSIHLPVKLATVDFIRKIHQHNCLAFVFTVNQVDKMRQLRRLGADGIFSDFPERVLAARENPHKPA